MGNGYKEYISKDEVEFKLTTALDEVANGSVINSEETFRFSDLSTSEQIVNFRVNDSGFLEKRTGTRLAVSMPYKIRGALAVSTADADQIYVVAGSRLYKLTMGSDGMLSNLTLGTLSGAVFSSDTERAEVFMFAGKVCVLAGGEYFSSDGYTVSKVNGYIPLIQKNTNPLGEGEAYERINLLTNKVRMRFIADGSTRNFKINYPVVSVDEVYNGSTLIENTDYTVNIEDSKTTVTLQGTATGDKGLEIYFTLNKTDERSRVTSCRHYVKYGEGLKERAFLYGGNETSNIFPSEPSDAVNSLTASFDYFPVGSQITVGNDSQAVYGVCCFSDKLAAFTSGSSYLISPRNDGEVNGINQVSFTLSTLCADYGTTENGGVIAVGNSLYFIDRDALYCLSQSDVGGTYSVVRIELPKFIGITADTIAATKFFIDVKRNELWLYGNGNGVAIYSTKFGCWYSFTGYNALGIFTFQGEPAYFKDKKLYLTNTSVYADSGTKYSAYCESGWLDFGDASKLKRIKRIAISVDASETSRSLTAKLTADCGVYPENDTSTEAHALRTAETIFTAPPADSPTTFKTRGRLGRVSRLKVTITSAADGTALTLREFSVTV